MRGQGEYKANRTQARKVTWNIKTTSDCAMYALKRIRKQKFHFSFDFELRLHLSYVRRARSEPAFRYKTYGWPS